MVTKANNANAKEKASPPVFDCKVGAFQGSIFLNNAVNKQGQPISYPSVSFQKSWTTDGANWQRQSMSFFNALEVRKAILVLEELEGVLLRKNYEANNQAPEAQAPEAQ